MMHKITVPHEENKILEGHQKVMYTVEDEHFCTKNYGSSAEEFATMTAVKEFEDLADEALQRFHKGECSPLEHIMYKNRMDIATLASATGFFQFQIKRHFKPKIFQKLNDKKLQIYADIFMIDKEKLRGFSGTIPT